MSFKEISEDDSADESRNRLLADATQALEQALHKIRSEATRRLELIQELAKDEPASEEAKWLPISDIAEQRLKESEAVRNWAAEQEQAAKQEFDFARKQAFRAYPVRPKTQHFLVYCTNCGHVLTAIPQSPSLTKASPPATNAPASEAYIPAVEVPRRPRAFRSRKKSVNHAPAVVLFVLAMVFFIAAGFLNDKANEADKRAVSYANSVDDLGRGISTWSGSTRYVPAPEPKLADRSSVRICFLAGIILFGASVICFVQAKPVARRP